MMEMLYIGDMTIDKLRQMRSEASRQIERKSTRYAKFAMAERCMGGLLEKYPDAQCIYELAAKIHKIYLRYKLEIKGLCEDINEINEEIARRRKQ